MTRPPPLMHMRAPLAVAVVGIGATIAVAAAVGAPTHDAGVLILIAMAGSLGVGLVGGLVMRALRQRSLLSQIIAVALVAVVAVAAGAAAAAQAMFLSSHDLGALAVVLVGAATVATVMAIVLGGQIVRGTELVGSAARRFADDPGTIAPASPGSPASEAPANQPVPAELASLATEIDEIRASLEESRQRERALEQSRRELVAWVSHDLRTPLAGLRAMVEALDDGIVHEPDDVSAYLHSMRSEVDRLAALVTDLFELSRIQSGTLTLHPARVSVADLVSDVLAGASPIAAARGVRLGGEVDDHPTQADVSVPEFQRALHNLVDNAIRHTPANGEVRLHVGVDDGHAVVTVEDECGGIPDDELHRVFDVAFSGDRARTPRPDAGAGLGLSITRGIVEAHSGDVDVRNAGAGCQFTIRLPLATAH